jgi:hypothetical protein
MVIRATRTKNAGQAIACVDAFGNVERFGLFTLVRLPHHGGQPDTSRSVAGERE